jgi:hypothetical protein
MITYTHYTYTIHTTGLVKEGEQAVEEGKTAADNTLSAADETARSAQEGKEQAKGGVSTGESHFTLYYTKL